MYHVCVCVRAQDDTEVEPRMWRELTRDRILRALDASLVVLHITTARNMPQQVYLEESIEQVIHLSKFHLEKNIYPEFDPVYRAESKGVSPLHTCVCTLYNVRTCTGVAIENTGIQHLVTIDIVDDQLNFQSMV